MVKWKTYAWMNAFSLIRPATTYTHSIHTVQYLFPAMVQQLSHIWAIIIIIIFILFKQQYHNNTQHKYINSF